jgi:signal transduction histidine kinase
MIRIMEPGSRLSRILAAEAQADAKGVERKIATVRIFLAAACLLVVFWDQAATGNAGPLLRFCLLAYLIYALAIRLILRLRAPLRAPFILALHAFDVVFAAALTVFSREPLNAYDVIFIFALMSAAWRWSFRATNVTAVASAVLVLLVNAFRETPMHRIIHAPMALMPEMLIPMSYLSVLGVTAGFMAAALRRLYAESYMISRIARSIHADAGMEPNLADVCGAILNLTGGREMLLVIQETASSDPALWRVTAQGAEGYAIQAAPPGAEGLERYFFPVPGRIWWWEQARAGAAPDYRCRVLDEQSARSTPGQMWLPGSFRTAHSCNLLLAAAWSAAPVFRLRAFILDPDPEMRRLTALLFFHKIMARVIPALVDVYVTRKTHLMAAALERSSLVRELHDGVVQALITIEMQLEAHRRLCPETDPEVAGQMCRIQEQLRQETMNLRLQMQRLRDHALSPRECLHAIRGIAAQHQDETGIDIRLDTELDAVMLSPTSCSELVKIVQEALVNVRKHSRAASVQIGLAQTDGEVRCSVCDDGAGFGFSGRRTLAELDAAGLGPAVIKERVRLVGGNLLIESTPGRGSCLEITIPRGE